MAPTNFIVCPHDTSKAVTPWVLLHSKVSERAGLTSRFDVFWEFAEFAKFVAGDGVLWGYVNPADFMKLRARGFSAFARPTGKRDQAYLVAPVGKALPTEGKPRITAVDGYILKVASRTLPGLKREFELIKGASYAELINLLRSGKADAAVIYGEYFDGITPMLREDYQILEIGDPGLSHLFVAHPSLTRSQVEALRSALYGLGTTAEGTQLLKDVGLTGFEPIPADLEAAFAAALG